MNPTAVINVVGLSRSLLSEHTPHLNALIERTGVCRLDPVLPAVTCSVQASMLTGVPPREHGIVGNGWYDRRTDEIRFWQRSNRLVQAEQVWDTAKKRDASFTCLNMFWRYAAYSNCDWSVIERPIYTADSRKIPDVYSNIAALRDELQEKLGRFPLFRFWGPAASIESSWWIARATMHTFEQTRPTLSLTYLPHLDYGLQKFGPDDPHISEHVRAIDEIVGELVDFFDERDVRVIVVSEYGIEAVSTPMFINRALRALGVLEVREELGRELLEPGSSPAFAVADHQVAHLYVRDEPDIERVTEALHDLDGVSEVLDRKAQYAAGIDHERAGELVVIAEAGHWFAYDYWLEDDRAPDFARTVEIHRKPGYDPRELFIDPRFRVPRVAVASRLLRRRLGFRTPLDVIPLDAALVRGSHGRTDGPDHLKPLLIAANADPGDGVRPCTDVRDVILTHLFDAV